MTVIQCPVCGWDEPHEHTVEEFVNSQKESEKLAGAQKARRDALHESVYSRLTEDVRRAQSALDQYESACEFCRMIKFESLKHDCDWKFGFIVDLQQETARCPKCLKVLEDWET